MRTAILLFLLFVCPTLRATTVVCRIADAHMRAVSGATIEFQLIEMGHGTTPARPITITGIQNYYRITTRCDGSFKVRLLGNDGITTAKTLWQVRIIAPGFYLGPYDFAVTGRKLDLNILGPLGTLSLKAKFYWGNDIPPFRYSVGCHIQRILDPFR